MANWFVLGLAAVWTLAALAVLALVWAEGARRFGCKSDWESQE